MDCAVELGGSRSKLTFNGTETPSFILAVVHRSRAPEVAILTPNSGAIVEPLAVVHERDGAGLPVGVPLDGVNL